jgi:metal-sulfur cluster biosynthetic enzyme
MIGIQLSYAYIPKEVLIINVLCIIIIAMVKITKDTVLDALKAVIDPEIGINVVDLGLIYNIDISNNNIVKIKMTLTTPMCPLSTYLVENVRNTIQKISGVKKVDVDVVFNPPWSIERIKPDIREKLGLGV